LVIEEPGVTLPTTPQKPKPKPSPQQMEVLKAIAQRKSVFVTGSAGTGKSFIVEDALQILRGMYGEDNVFVTASTGLAACAIGGITLHSFAGVGIGVNESKEQLADKVSIYNVHNQYS
jgi:ATP-dependent DNA helicase PIF1